VKFKTNQQHESDMKQHILIAPVGEEMETLFPILRTFPTEKIILIANNKTWKQAHDFKETLKVFRIPVGINKVETYSIDELFQSKKYY